MYGHLLVKRSQSPEGKYPKVYAFSTFFYTTLRDQGYSRVQRWTKKVCFFIFICFSFLISFNEFHFK